MFQGWKRDVREIKGARTGTLDGIAVCVFIRKVCLVRSSKKLFSYKWRLDIRLALLIFHISFLYIYIHTHREKSLFYKYIYKVLPLGIVEIPLFESYPIENIFLSFQHCFRYLFLF